MMRRTLSNLHTASLSCLLVFACSDEGVVGADDGDDVSDGAGDGGGGTEGDSDGGTSDESGGDEDTGDTGDTGDSGEGSDGGADDTSGDGTDDGGTDSSGDDGGTDSSGDDGGTDSSGDDGGTDSTGDSGSTGEACEPSDHDFQLQLVAPSAVLILDKSGSMTTKWDHDGDKKTSSVSRWHSLYSVVEVVLDGFADSIDFGAQLAPAVGASQTNGDPSSCIVSNPPEVPVGPDNAANVLSSIPGPDDMSIRGGTALTAAVHSAVDHLLAMGSPAGRALVMVTDGAANCASWASGNDIFYAYDTDLAEVVRQAHDDHGIPTYVVGIDIVDEDIQLPVVNPHQALTEVAIAGGVPKNGAEKFYNASDETELLDALATISGFIECSISLPAEPPYPDLVEVEVDGVPVPRVTDCATEDGWIFPNQGMGSYSTITMCGDACVAGEVHVAYGCP